MKATILAMNRLPTEKFCDKNSISIAFTFHSCNSTFVTQKPELAAIQGVPLSLFDA
jgi:hypothetical protein